MDQDANIPIKLRIVHSAQAQNKSPESVSDSAIPLLTEVMDFQKIDLDDPTSLDEPKLGAMYADATQVNGASGIANPDDPNFAKLKQQLQDNILERLLEKSDQFLALEFQERITPLLERTVSSMVQDLQINLEQVLRDAVAKAITEELNKLNQNR